MRVFESMSDFYSVLSRVYQEVTPVVPVRKAQKRRPKASTGQLLFAEPSALVYQQVLPGVFVKGVETSGKAVPCLWFLDATKPLVLLGMTHDFAGTSFKWPVYQVPVFLGDGATLNLEPKLVETYQKREKHRLPAQIDKGIQTLIAALVDLAVPSAVVHTFIDASRVWAIEDYLSASYRLKLKGALSALTEKIYEQKIQQADQQGLVKMIQELKKVINELNRSTQTGLPNGKIFYAVLEGVLGGTAPAVLATALEAFMSNAAEHHQGLEDTNEPPNAVLKVLSETASLPETYKINRFYLSFVMAQLPV